MNTYFDEVDMASESSVEIPETVHGIWNRLLQAESRMTTGDQVDYLGKVYVSEARKLLPVEFHELRRAFRRDSDFAFDNSAEHLSYLAHISYYIVSRILQSRALAPNPEWN